MVAQSKYEKNSYKFVDVRVIYKKTNKAMSKAKTVGKQKANRGNQVKRARVIKANEAILSKFKS
jgi:hypothetical protein